MAMHHTSIRRLPQLAAQCQRTARLPSLQGQSFMTLCRAQSIIARTTRVTHKTPQGLRAFSKYAALRKVHNESQEAPNAKAYLDSGAILGGRNLVDVRKVLVIGSGGLAIGQAGEFDYSGTSSAEDALSGALRNLGYGLIISCRFASSESAEGSWSRFSTHQPQHRNHSDCPRSGR